MPGAPPELRWGWGLNNRASGDLGEELARRYLASKGCDIVESNYRTRCGELDLISRQVDTLILVEVKLRRGITWRPQRLASSSPFALWQTRTV